MGFLDQLRAKWLETLVVLLSLICMYLLLISPPPASSQSGEPVITLTQSGSSVAATGVSLTDYGYFTSAKNPNCSSTNTTSTYITGTSASNLSNQTWVCFRAKNNSNVYGYAKLQVDLSQTPISITQTQSLVTASATGISSNTWQHFKTTDSHPPDCDGDSTGFGPPWPFANATTINTSLNNFWVCFRVKNSKGVYSYAKHQIDYNAPEILVTQTANSLSASSPDSDIDTSTWQKSGPHNSSNCTTSTTGFTTGSTVSNASNDKYYCFKVSDEAGNTAYKEYQYKSSAEPILTLTQEGSTVSAETTNLSDHKYFTSTSDPDCSGSYGSWSSATSGTSKTSLTQGTWICFRAKNSLNVYGYSELEVDLSPPTLKVNQDQISVEALTGESLSGQAGSSVSIDGSYMAVGAPYGRGDSGSDTGAVYIFKHDGSRWTLEQELSDQPIGFTVLESGDFFGSSVSLRGDRLAVGAPQDNGWGTDGTDGSATGATYIFKRLEEAWVLEQELSDQETGFTDLKTGDQFGTSVAIDGDYLAVGAPQDDGWGTSGSNGENTGATYIFKYEPDGKQWVLDKAFIDEQTGFTSLQAGDLFGSSVSLYEARLAVGAPDDGSTGSGKAYVFKRTAGAWALEKDLSTLSGFTLSSGDEFGASISLGDTRLAVGSPGDSGHSGSKTGAAYVFKRSGSTWAFEQSLVDTSSGFTSLEPRDVFGTSLSLSGDDQLAVGSPGDAGSSGSKTGAVYVFERTGNTWGTPQEISDQGRGFTYVQAEDKFGSSVSLSTQHLSVGAPYDSGTSFQTGAVYAFQETSLIWQLEQEISDMPTSPNEDETTWQSFKTLGTQKPDCSESDSGWDSASSGSEARKLSLISTPDNTDNNKWVCFRVQNSRGIWGYVKYQIDFNAPVIEVVPSWRSALSQYRFLRLAQVLHLAGSWTSGYLRL